MAESEILGSQLRRAFEMLNLRAGQSIPVVLSRDSCPVPGAGTLRASRDAGRSRLQPYDEQYQACDAFHVFSYVFTGRDGCRDDRFGSVLPGVIQQHAKLRKIRDCVQRSAVKRRVSPFGCLGLSFGRPAISLQNPLQASVEFYKIIIRPALFFPPIRCRNPFPGGKIRRAALPTAKIAG